MRNQTNWMNIKTLLPSAKANAASSQALNLLRNTHDSAVAGQLLTLMVAGADAVHAYMTKLFTSNNPI
jgi:hypothetical protein